MTFHKNLIGQDLHGGRSFTGTGSPVGVRTPGIVGEQYFDTVAKIQWVAYGLTNTSWTNITGGSGASAAFEYTTFDYTTTSPLDFGLLNPGDVVVLSDVIVEVPFDDPTAILTLGQASNTGNILDSTSIDPTTSGTYNSIQAFPISGADAIRLQVVPGTSTQGSGIVVVSIRRA